ncbi:MAG: hypothetical protein HY040_12205 [Planctomycetes bacterium]|nr:hypothetical protein [Planctomycetota bacterium]
MRFVFILLFFFVGLEQATAPVQANFHARSQALDHTSAITLQRQAGLFDYVSNNRSRMIQITTIAFAIGLAILLTSVRKH